MDEGETQLIYKTRIFTLIQLMATGKYIYEIIKDYRFSKITFT